MMRIISKKNSSPVISPRKRSVSCSDGGDSVGGGAAEVLEWEIRPGGMLVQKRTPDSDRATPVAPVPTIRVRVKYGSIYHEVYINSQATFGELKKKLEAPTGLHPQDQKILFKDKEKDSKAYLDVVGVKDRSKLVVIEDPTSQERRYIEMQKTKKMEKAAKSISGISLEVDKLASQVASLETVISKGGKVVENDVLNLIELLMNQLIKLDGIVAEGDAKLQRRMQVTRVQKYVESLDLMKVKIATSKSDGVQSQIPHNSGARNQLPRGNDIEGQIPHSNGIQNQSLHSNGIQHSNGVHDQLHGRNGTQGQNPLGNGVHNQLPRTQPQSVRSNGVRNRSPLRNGVHAPFPFTNGGKTPTPHSNGEIATITVQAKQNGDRPTIPVQPKQQQPQQHYHQRPPRHNSAANKDVVVTTKWETFEPALLNPNTSTAASTNKLNWEFFE